MINLGVQYSTSRPKEIEVTSDSVFMATNITPYQNIIEGRPMSGYSYNCLQYTKDEYIAKLHQDIMDTQIALVELYEGGDVL